jgi:excisionase family DNA binding protein
MKNLSNPFLGTMVMSLGAMDVLNKLAPELDVWLKWPNDIYLEDAKLAGILSESLELDDKRAIAVGLGVNLNLSAAELADIDKPAASVEKGKINPEKFASELAKSAKMYYIMGMHSIHDYLKAIKNLGFFNPRLNTAYLCPVSLISENVIREVESDVICYGCSVRNQSVYTQINENKEKLYTVTDICNMTGLKKSTVYADIHSGVLIANRMGNKYVVNEIDYDRYVKYKKRIRILLTIIMVALMLFAALTVLYMIIALV